MRGVLKADNTRTYASSCTSSGLSGEVRRGFYPPGRVRRVVPKNWQKLAARYYCTPGGREN
eukprot:scaffold66289_cov75-Phaeocystis_antarctica.AAC.1